jgi:hypothetical protein
MAQYAQRVSVYPSDVASSAYYGVSAATVMRTGPARVGLVNVITAGTAGAVYDAAATGAATSGRLVLTIPATVGIYTANWPCNQGVVVAPGAAQVLNITLG